MAAQQHCPVCSSSAIELFFESRGIPAFCNVLHATRAAACATERGTLSLGLCRACGHIYNYAFDPKLMEYSQTYENSLHFSPRFQAYAEQLAHDLIARHGLHDSSIIEIGCGKGDFLKLICEAGNNRGVGFDASFQPELIEKDERFTVIRDFYSEKYSHIKADFLICRHVLEHMESPRTFIADLPGANRPQPICYFEVPNALRILRATGVWDLIYEHCSHFTPQSLAHLFSSSGFAVLRLEEHYGGQFLGIEAKRSQGQPDRRLTSGVEEIEPLARQFAENHRNRIDTWAERFNDWNGKRVVVWGSGSKGVTFLNVMKPNIEYIVDINPRKQGMYVAGTGQQIVAPGFLIEYRPDAIIIMNPLYEEEIRTIASEIGIAAELTIA